MGLRNVMVSSHDGTHDDVKNIVSSIGLKHGYWFEQEDKTTQITTTEIHFRADVTLHREVYDKTKQPIVYIEVQLDDSKGWREKMERQYDGKCYCIIPLKSLKDCTMSVARNRIEAWLMSAILSPPKEIKHSSYTWECEWCGRKFKGRMPHVMNCSSNPDNRRSNG